MNAECQPRTSFTEYLCCEDNMATYMEQGISTASATSKALNILDMLAEPMATENPRNFTSDHLCKNLAPNSPERHHSLEPAASFGMLMSRTGNEHRTTTYQNGFVPPRQQNEFHPQDVNNNSERILEVENHVIKILSTKDCCTIFDIQKSLPAVTSPKCVNTTMTNLEKKGLVKVLDNHPHTWIKANSDPLDRRKSFNGCSSLYRTTKDSLASSIHDCLQDLHSSRNGQWDQAHENGFTNEISYRSRSTSSPLPFHKQPVPKYSRPTPNGFSSRRPPQRKNGTWKLDVNEQELHNGSYHEFSCGSLGIDSQDDGILDEFVMQNCRSPGSLDLENECKVDGTNNVRRLSLENLPRKNFPLGSHKPSIIEVVSQNRRSPEPLDMENEFVIGQNGVRRLSLNNLKMAQRLNHKRSSIGSFNSKRDPGIIGEERMNKTNCRKTSSSEQTWLPGKRFSSSVYGGSMDVRPCSRSFGSNAEIKSCGLCKISFASKQQSEEHFQSTKHLNKIAKVTSEPYLKFCDYCKVSLNSKSQANEHFSSGRHEQTVAKSQKAPIRNHPPLKVPTEEDFEPVVFTHTKPYEYQLELYCKAITTNSVYFLPTGTGKTLVAALVLTHLLQLNPSRQIIFLVDRVLLVLQQSDYLKSELKHVRIPVSAKNEEQPAVGSSFVGQYSNLGLQRPLRIGAICGEMRKLEQGVPIFNHDILVVTADCYRNHITNGTLRFEDGALIVLDESHHCNKDHPYNVIIRDYYLPDEIPMFHRPKILGLSASPAGELTLDRTVKKMQRLLANLGGASLLTVTDRIQELTERTSNAEIVCRYAEYTTTERNLLGFLIEYATKCFNVAARVTEFKEYKDVFQPSSGGVLSKDDIYPILDVIDKLLISSKQKNNPMQSLLHFQIICDSICTLQECGEKLACDRMAQLFYSDHGFDWAQDQGLPCENIRSYLDKYNNIAYCGNDGIVSGVAELLELLTKMNLEQQEDEDHHRPLALVLVKRIPTAVSLAKYLDACPVLRGTGIRTLCICGNEPHDWGMTKAQQRDTLSSIQEGTFQVVVATNLEGEKLDQSTLKLVVQLDPPNSASALVQIRARARERQTLYAAISRDKDLEKKMKDLLVREKNMVQAAEFINCYDVPGIY